MAVGGHPTHKAVLVAGLYPDPYHPPPPPLDTEAAHDTLRLRCTARRTFQRGGGVQ